MSLLRMTAPSTVGTALGNSRSAWRSNTKVAGPRFTEGDRLESTSPAALRTNGRNTWTPLRIPGSRAVISQNTSPAVKLPRSASYQNGNSKWLVPLLERS